MPYQCASHSDQKLAEEDKARNRQVLKASSLAAKSCASQQPCGIAFFDFWFRALYGRAELCPHRLPFLVVPGFLQVSVVCGGTLPELVLLAGP